MPSFFERVSLAFKLFFSTICNPEIAERLERSISAEQPSAAQVPHPVHFKEAQPDAALQLLGLLQQDGRFIDFLEEDVTAFSDAEIGAAARVVHQGCRNVVRDHFKIVPVRVEPEGTRITLQEGFDASSIHIAGNVVGKPPYTGSLVHRGWRAGEVSLPKVSAAHDLRVLAPAEVEL